MNISELFWKASLDEIKEGYMFDMAENKFICLVCGEAFVKGIIYPDEDVLYEAERSVQNHISKKHDSMFDFLLSMDKKYTGLTGHQKELLKLFYCGCSDGEIAKKLDIGSISTIRNHRFTLHERKKEARIFLAIMDLLDDKTGRKQKFIDIHRGATRLDERYSITEEEREKIIKNYFDRKDGRLLEFASKEKKKIVILQYIMKKFNSGRKYTEKEVNSILKDIYHDFATLRRYLIEYGFMERTTDCSEYRVKDN